VLAVVNCRVGETASVAGLIVFLIVRAQYVRIPGQTPSTVTLIHVTILFVKYHCTKQCSLLGCYAVWLL
jgi:hypothetical protein